MRPSQTRCLRGICNKNYVSAIIAQAEETWVEPVTQQLNHGMIICSTTRTEFIKRCTDCPGLAFLLTENTPPITELIFSHLVHQQNYILPLSALFITLISNVNTSPSKVVQLRIENTNESEKSRTDFFLTLQWLVRLLSSKTHSQSLLPENQSNVERNFTPTELSHTLILLRKPLQLCYLSWKPPDRYIQTQCTRSHSEPTHCNPHPSFTAASLLLTYTEMRSNLNLYINKDQYAQGSFCEQQQQWRHFTD